MEVRKWAEYSPPEEMMFINFTYKIVLFSQWDLGEDRVLEIQVHPDKNESGKTASVPQTYKYFRHLFRHLTPAH